MRMGVLTGSKGICRLGSMGKRLNPLMAHALILSMMAGGNKRSFEYEPEILSCKICGKDCPPYKKACCEEHWKLMNPRPKFGRVKK